MRISLLQSIGIIGTMTVEFPVDVKGLFSWMSIFLLDAWTWNCPYVKFFRQKNHSDFAPEKGENNSALKVSFS